MSAQNPAGGPLVEGPPDPEHDPTASYALEPEYVETLTAAVLLDHRGDRRGALAAQRRSRWRTSRSRRDADVAQAFARARGRSRPGPRTPLDERAAILLRLHDLVLDRQDEIIDLIVLGVRQGAQARVRRAAARRADRPLLRAYGAPAPRHPAQARRRSRPDPGRGQPRPQGRRRHHLAVELPVHDGALRRPARRCSPATPWSPSPTPRPCSPRCSAPQLLEEAGFPKDLWQVVAGPGSEIGTGDHRAAPTTSASPARPPPASSSPGSAPTG